MAINHVIKSIILINQIYLLNYTMQNNYWVIQTKLLTTLPLKNIEMKDCSEVVQILKENLIEYLYAVNIFIK